jgi:hypothetical protein
MYFVPDTLTLAQRMEHDFVFGVIRMVDDEKDPRCLMQAFSLIPVRVLLLMSHLNACLGPLIFRL